MKNQPIIKKRDKGNSVAIFKDKYTTSQGEVRSRFSCSVQRSYKDKKGEWQQSAINCFIEDLLPLSCLLENCYIAFNKYLENGRKTGNDYSSLPSNSGMADDTNYDDDIPF